MRIALDTTYATGPNLTGVGIYSREIAWGVAAANPKDEFYFCYRPHRWRRSLADPLPSNALRCLLLDWLPPRMPVFHALNQRVPRRKGRMRVVTTFHDLFVFTARYSTPEFRARFCEQARRAAAQSDLIIAVSAFTASQVVEILNVEHSRIRVIHHGVHLPASVPPPNAREPFILCVGAIQYRKNTARLVEAFETLPADWRLVLAGAREGFGAAEAIGTIDRSPARARIELTGYIDNAALRDLYRKASIFAFPSLDEGFGMPLLEAMAWGIPVVTSTTSAMPEVAGDAALFVEPHDTQALATALNRLCNDEELRRKYSGLGQLRASKFTWQKAIRETCSVYRELLA